MQYKVKEARQEQRMTQEELSTRSGVSRATISGLESGEIRVAKTDTLIKLANALNKSVGDIFLP